MAYHINAKMAKRHRTAAHGKQFAGGENSRINIA